jgi:hypothetical protein
MQGKPRKIPWISLDSFGRIGTFQWVMTNPNKKTPHAELASRIVLTKDLGRPFFACFSGSWSAPYSARGKTLSHISIY